jgi:hypothetical protein
MEHIHNNLMKLGRTLPSGPPNSIKLSLIESIHKIRILAYDLGELDLVSSCVIWSQGQ